MHRKNKGQELVNWTVVYSHLEINELKNIQRLIRESAQEISHPINKFVSACRKLAEDFYVTSSGGNLAWKLEDNLILISPTKMNKGDIYTEDVMFIDMDGYVAEGKKRPTGETPMYLKFFGERSDVVSVTHCHPLS